MNFKTVFDLASEKVDYFNHFLALAYPFFILGVCLIIFYLKNIKRRTQTIKNLIIGIAFVSISTIFILVFLGGQILGIRKAKQIINDKQFLMVEGQPENYHPMPKEGHDTERFDIEGVHFEYSDFALSYPGYHHAASLGGVITPNNYYRLTYYKADPEAMDENKILKIEISQ